MLDEMQKAQDEYYNILNKLKAKVKEHFWMVKGYDKKSIKNWQLIDEGIEFGIEAMTKQQ